MSSGIRLSITGRVQGVGFRLFTVQAAQRFSVQGWVRNRPDGSVEAEGYGSPEQLESWVSALREGPPMARIDSIQTAPVPLKNVPPAFTIR